MHDSLATLHNKALSLYQENRLHDALNIYKRICKQAPKDAQAWHMSSAILAMQGKYEPARYHCEKAIKLMPGEYGPYINLGSINKLVGRLEEARSCFDKALEIKPGDAQALSNIGALLIDNGQFDEASHFLNQALQSDPQNHEAWNNLGIILQHKGNEAAAEKHFKHSIELNPAYTDAYTNLGSIYIERLLYDEAETCFQKGLQLDPGNKSLMCSMGILFQYRGDFNQARTTFKNALEIYPDDEELLALLASLYEKCGETDHAMSILKPLLDRYTSNVCAIITFSKLSKKSTQRRKSIELLESLLHASTSNTNLINIRFSLGDLYNDMNEYDAAFEQFQQANNMEMPGINHPPPNKYFNTLMEVFSRENMDTLPRTNNNSRLPVFIVGMPRSGTSLVEQILATHPNVEAGGERGDIINIIDKLNGKQGTNAKYPQLLTSMKNDDMEKIASKYLQSIEMPSRDHIRFTDKTPLQGTHLGFINLLLPKSRIIICNRNPLDTCLSIYFKRLDQGHYYAMDLKTLGNFYVSYHRLLQYWVSTLDITVLQVQYEDLVENSEQEIRSIIEFCDLEWNPACLEFHKNKRIVNTASYKQVRQPMYSSSINRWKHYENHIGELIDAISDIQNP